MSYYRLKTLEGDRVYPLDNGFLTLGRDPDCCISIDDQQLSRHHCVLEVEDNSVVLRDLGSTNGTKINGERVHSFAKLKKGDIIKIGKTILLMELQLPDETIAIELLTKEVAERPGDEISFTDGQGNIYPLIATATDSEFFLGRSEDCEVQLYEVGVSSKHAKLSYDNGRWILDDLGSKNGTIVNGKCAACTPLSDGDKITLGTVSLTVSLPAVPSAKKKRRWWPPKTLAKT